MSIKLRHILIILYIGLSLIGMFFPHRLWAFSAIALLHPVIQIVLCLFLLSMLPSKGVEFWSKIAGWKGRLLLEGRLYKGIATSILIGAVLGTLGWQDNQLMGDGAQVLQRIIQFPDNLEYGSNRFITVMIYKMLTTPLEGGLGLFRSIQIVHIFMAAGYMIFAFMFTRKLAKDGLSAFSIYTVFAGSGIFMIFNHVEVYGPALLLGMWAYYILLFRNQEERGIWLYLIPAALASALHPLFLYLFGFVALIYLHRYLPQYALSVMIGATAIIAMGIGWTDVQHKLFIKDNFILFAANPEYFVSWAHLLLFGNYVLFISPLVPLFLRYVGGEVSLEKARTGARDILIWGSFTALVMVFLIDFKLGGGDWDLTSLILLPLLLYIIFKIRRLDRRHLYTTAAALAGVFLFINIATSITRDMEYRRGEQLLYDQGVPFLQKRYPGWNRMVFLATRMYDFIDDQQQCDIARTYAERAITERPHDYIGYLYASIVYNCMDRNDLAEQTLTEGMINTGHSDKLRKALEMLYTTEDMIAQQYAFPYFRPQPMTMRREGKNSSREEAADIISEYTALSPDTIAKEEGYGLSYKYTKADIPFEIRLLPDKIDIYAPILYIRPHNNPQEREAYLSIVSTAWQDVRAGKTEPFKVFVEETHEGGTEFYIGTTLRYTNLGGDALLEIVQKGEYLAGVYQTLFSEKAKGSYEYLTGNP